jgi:hypothetical protein
MLEMSGMLEITTAKSKTSLSGIFVVRTDNR